MEFFPSSSSAHCSSSSSAASSSSFTSSPSLLPSAGYSFPTEVDEICMDHLVDSHRTKAIGSVCSSFNGPSLCSLVVSSSSIASSNIGEFHGKSILGANQGYQMNEVDINLKPSALEVALSTDMLDTFSRETKLAVPQKPLMLLPTNFSTERDAEGVMEALKGLFDNGFMTEVDYDLVSEVDSDISIDEDSSVDYEVVDFEYGFNGVYIHGSKFCDFKIRLYRGTDDEESSTIIEMQRIHKDSCGFTFKRLFEAVKARFQTSTTPNSITSTQHFEKDSLSTSSLDVSTSMSCAPLSQEKVSEAINQVLSMIEETDQASKLEASRMLCDLTEEPEIRQQMIGSDCISALVTAASSKSQIIQLHSVIALAQLSECHDCIDSFLASGSLPLLMSLVKNGSYRTAAMRREAARAIANVVMRGADRVVTAMQSHQEVYRAWATRIPSLKEPTIRERSERAMSYLVDLGVDN